MKAAILRYLTENWDDLLKLDMKLARVVGAPAPHTLSSYAYLSESKKKLGGRIFRPIIDLIFKWLRDDVDHCKKDFERVTNASNA